MLTEFRETDSPKEWWNWPQTNWNTAVRMTVDRHEYYTAEPGWNWSTEFKLLCGLQKETRPAVSNIKRNEYVHTYWTRHTVLCVYQDIPRQWFCPSLQLSYSFHSKNEERSGGLGLLINFWRPNRMPLLEEGEWFLRHCATLRLYSNRKCSC